MIKFNPSFTQTDIIFFKNSKLEKSNIDTFKYIDHKSLVELLYKRIQNFQTEINEA